MQLSEEATNLLKRYYMRPEEQYALDAYRRAANCFSGGDKGLEERIVSYAAKGWFMFASPVLFNAVWEGETPRGLPISCFLSYVPDSLEGLIEHSKEIRWLSVKGGGVGGHWSEVRNASDISPGSIPFIKTIDSDMEAYRQGFSRKGSYAAYLDISHPDVLEFLNIRIPTGGDANRKCFNLHHAVNIPDSFMKAVEEDAQWDFVSPHTKEVVSSMSARQLFQQLLEVRFKTGEPYFCFIDTANRELNPYLKAQGLRINGSNLCVAPETQILTTEGYKRIGTLENKKVVVWNGEEWSKTVVYKTGTGKQLVRVTFSDGSTIDCTPEHRFYIQESYNKQPVILEAQDLYLGAKLEKFALPIEGVHQSASECDSSMAYSLGFYAGDGNEGYKFSWVYPPKHCVVSLLVGSVSKPDSLGRMKWVHGEIQDKFNVPLNKDFEYRIKWLAGLLDADGCVIKSDNCDNIQLVSVKLQFLHEIKLLLQEMGVHSSVSLRRKAGKYLLPDNKGEGNSAIYECQEVWMLNINGIGVQRLVELGLKPLRLDLNSKQIPQREASKFVTVVSVEYTGRVSDTFCCTEPLRNKIMLNGILTGNCNEIYLPTNENRTAVCCLSSVNLEYYDEWKDTTMVQDLTVMLDNVLGFFIWNAPKELWRAVDSAKRERSLGLGAMGYHAYLQKNNLPWNHWRAMSLNIQMFKHIKEQAVIASKRMAQERGEPEDIKGSGMRNAHLLAIAPNANSSIILDTSPSIEPWLANGFKRMSRTGTFLVKNRYLEKVLDYYHKNTDDVWKDIITNKGSVQHLTFLTQEEKEVFKTAMEIDQHLIVEHAAARQPFICQGQSVNLFFPYGSDINYVAAVHLKAFKKGLKGLYYLRTEAGKSAETVSSKVERNVLKEAEGCVACQG